MSEFGDQGEGSGDGAVDPLWWLAVYDSADAGSENGAPEYLAHDFASAAEAAAENAGSHTLHARVLRVLALVTSPMLAADNWNDPFRPMWEVGGRRSALPQDLTQDELALLARIAPELEPAGLRARAADIAWTYGPRTDHSLLAVTLDAYLAGPVSADTWHRGVGDGYRRALELARRRGKAGAEVVSRLSGSLLEFVLTARSSDGWAVVHAAELLHSAGRPTVGEAAQIAEHLWELTDSVSPDLGRGLLRQIVRLRVTDLDVAHRAQEAIAELYAVEAEQRLLHDGSAMVASLSVEKAIATLRGLPRKYRTTHGIEPWLRELRRELVDLREETLEEMTVISSDGIDITQFVSAAQRAVAGTDRVDALVRLSTITPLIDLPGALASERDQAPNLFSRMLGRITFAGDGRKVGQHDAISGNALTDDEAMSGVIRGFAQRVQLQVQVRIHPALQVVTFEHRYDMAVLLQICHESPLVPAGHEELWARGLLHGLSGDLPSAISLLIPQVEQLLRRHLKLNGVDTLSVDADGTEKEKSLGSLLETPEIATTLGTNWAFELRTLLSEQLGLNLRNDLAHGLLADAGAWSAGAVYAWWHCLRLVVIPYSLARVRLASAAADSTAVDVGPDEPGG